jgi:hypothetical protein
MISLSTEQKPVLQWHPLIKGKISIGLKKLLVSILIKKSLIFLYLILFPPTTHRTYGLEKLSILAKESTPIG